MPWYARMGLLLSVVFAVGLIGTVVVRYFRRPTLSPSAWGGVGTYEKLAPEEAALLLGLHPGALLALLFFRLRDEGKVRLLGEKPLAIEWIGATPTSQLERGVLGALDEAGHLRSEKVVGLLDSLFRDVDMKMAPWSGQETTRHYELKVEALLDRTLRADPPADAAEQPWMMLLDPRPIWDGLGNEDLGQALKTMFRLKERFREEVLAMDEVAEAARHPAGGFFAYCRDLPGKSTWRVDSDMVAMLPSAWR